jgi:hypothetical protein
MITFESGDIIFIRGKGPLSRLITLFDGKFSHVCLAVTNKKIFEAQYLTKSSIVDFYYNETSDPSLVLRLPLSSTQKIEVPELALQLTGKRYNYIEILIIMLKIIFGKKRIPNWYSPNAMICCESVAILLENLGFIKDRNELIDCDISDLEEELIKRGGKVVYTSPNFW